MMMAFCHSSPLLPAAVSPVSSTIFSAGICRLSRILRACCSASGLVGERNRTFFPFASPSSITSSASIVFPRPVGRTTSELPLSSTLLAISCWYLRGSTAPALINGISGTSATELRVIYKYLPGIISTAWCSYDRTSSFLRRAPHTESGRRPRERRGGNLACAHPRGPCDRHFSQGYTACKARRQENSYGRGHKTREITQNSKKNKNVFPLFLTMLPELSEIGKRRRRLGVTQTQLAKLAGVSQSLIAKIEAGKVYPHFFKFNRLSHFF